MTDSTADERTEARVLAHAKTARCMDLEEIIHGMAKALRSARQALDGVVSMDDEDGEEGKPSDTCQSVIAEIDAVLTEEWGK